MEVRYINKNEEVDFLKVSAASFIWKFDAEADTGTKVPVLGAFNDGKLIAGIEMYDFRVNYCGNVVNAIIASGVCSLPESRRMGGIRAIFDEIGRTAIENDWVLGFLHPFSIEYYGKFGYAHLNRMFSIKVPFEKLKSIPRNTDVVLYTGEQFDDLSALHEKCAMTENLMGLREEKKHFCDTPLEEADYTYLRYNESGEADGYVRFTVKRPDDLIVEDLYVLTPEALKGIVGFLRNYDGIVKNLIVKKQYQGSLFSCLTDGMDNVTYDYNGVAAGRIYNLKKLLEINAYPEEYGKFRVRCIDNLEQNNGVFEVEYQNGKANVTKTDGEYDICLTATAAAKLMLAGEGHTASTAVFIDGVTINGNADDFFRAFPYRVTRFVDSKWSE